MENIKFKFDFDDILIIPSTKTHIYSRYNGITLPKELPLITAPMDTVVDLNNMGCFFSEGITVALPRTIKYRDFKNFCVDNGVRETDYTNTFFSFGFEDLDVFYKNNFKDLHTNAHILIDVANGHMKKIIDYAREIKRLRPDIIIMVGNIANPETYRLYAENKCVDYIRIGIGNGNGCLTTKQSGIGHPMASLINETYQLKVKLEKMKTFKGNLPAIVADGGMKDYSDIIKSLALGADYVMIGSIFNKALESAAQNYIHGIKIGKKYAKMLFDNGRPVKKYFRGMSTKEAQKAMGKTSFKTSEGVVRFRRVEYHLSGWVENFEHYLRNMMSYVNARTLEEFRGNVEICQISKNAYDRFNK